MKQSPLQAWVASLPLALMIPAISWAAVLLWSGKPMSYVIGFLGMETIIHLGAYMLTGVPLFLLKYRSPDSLVWNLPAALLTGATLGAAVPGFLLLGRLPFLICAGHGLVTAFAAWLQRPRQHENTHHLP